MTGPVVHHGQDWHAQTRDAVDYEMRTGEHTELRMFVCYCGHRSQVRLSVAALDRLAAAHYLDVVGKLQRELIEAETRLKIMQSDLVLSRASNAELRDMVARYRVMGGERER